MNAYYKIIDKIRELAIADPDVNTVTKGLVDEIDDRKADVFPLVHITATPSTFNRKCIKLRFSINALSIRDKDNVPETDKFREQDNEDDNLNAMLYVLWRIYAQLSQFTEDDDFWVIGEPSIDPVLYAFKNLLDGWEMNIEIGVPVEEVSAC